MSFDLARFEQLHADVMLNSDPEAALAALPDADRELFAAYDRDGLRIAALMVARLRFERLIHGSRSAAEWFDRDPREFSRAFKRYHTSVPPTAIFPTDEARAFEAWVATG